MTKQNAISWNEFSLFGAIIIALYDITVEVTENFDDHHWKESLSYLVFRIYYYDFIDWSQCN